MALAMHAAQVPVASSTRTIGIKSHNVLAAMPRAGNRSRRSLKIQAVVTADSAVDVAKMAPLGDRLLVKPKEKEEKTSGGILLTTSSAPAMQDAIIGTVMAVGDEVDIGVKAGDQVLFSKYGSSDIEVPNGEVCFVAQKSILAKLE